MFAKSTITHVLQLGVDLQGGSHHLGEQGVARAEGEDAVRWCAKPGFSGEEVGLLFFCGLEN